MSNIYEFGSAYLVFYEYIDEGEYEDSHNHKYSRL
ncbi:MAG: hypothetical protein PWP46_2024 [Fusobacteriaceae bacterium]|nr:hypothetical protein [Fusobacteriaceae bacterium]